jgi:hypothetical protein
MGTHSFCIEEDMLGTFHHQGCPPSDVLLSSSIVIIDMRMSVVSLRGLNYQRLLANDTYVSEVMCEALLMEGVHLLIIGVDVFKCSMLPICWYCCRPFFTKKKLDTII